MENDAADFNESANSVIGLLLLIILDCIIIILENYYISCWQLWRVWLASKCRRVEEVATKKLCIDRNASERLPQEVEMLTDKPEAVSTENACCHNEELSTEELTTVLSVLGTCYDPDGDKLQDKLGSNDITALFEEQEPSLQEVKEAFSVFDQNKDGSIDATELNKVLRTLCFPQASEADCTRMINAFDDNGDGVIDLDEFVRLIASSFS
ncbi:probable calcium-binding protein CML45 [Ricinus communis]|uniref:probable calcium-binding protein CML45 n=1 Tax=Ricinus communis TaxID=3988 RepID=UPI00201A78AD|nr:probable calcium-binding protein CML45 [Ricinus communis]